MARIRTIKPSFFASEAVAVLRLRARLTWAGLWTNCDDDGRCKDNVRLIKAAIWPLDDDVSIHEVEEDLEELEKYNRIQRYEVGGSRYIQITNWDEHQKISHKTPSEIPAPPPPDPLGGQHGGRSGSPPVPLRESSGTAPGGTTEDDGSALDLFPEDSLQEGKGREGDKEGKNTSPRATRPPDLFPEFYEAFPRHVDRKDAEKAWAKAIKGHPPEEIISAAKRYATSCHGKPAKFVKYPATWLNKGGYLDEPDSPGLRLVSGDSYQGWQNPTDQSVYDEELLP